MSIIKSFQQGSIEIPTNELQADLTINPVNLDSALPLFTGLFCPSNSQIHLILTRIQLVDSTTVRAIRLMTDATSHPTVGFAVVEFEPTTINNVQSGVISILAGETEASALISSVVMNKSLISYLGHGATTTGGLVQHNYARLELADNTHVRALRFSTMGSLDIGYTVVEYI